MPICSFSVFLPLLSKAWSEAKGTNSACDQTMGCSTSLLNDDGMRTLKDFSSSGLCDSPDGFLKTSIILSGKIEVKVKFYFSLFIICMGVTLSDYYLSVSTHPSASLLSNCIHVEKRVL